jgi:hypothetical protein
MDSFHHNPEGTAVRAGMFVSEVWLTDVLAITFMCHFNRFFGYISDEAQEANFTNELFPIF